MATPGTNTWSNSKPFGLVDRHHLDGVLVGWFDGFPLLLVQCLDRIDVVEERAQREFPFDRLEAVHLLEERREVASALGRHHAIDVGVELVDDADAPDHLT